MRAKKAKAVRRAAREIAIESGIDQETHYRHYPRSRTEQGTFAVVECERAVIKQVKSIVKRSLRLPIAVIDREGFNSTIRETTA